MKAFYFLSLMLTVNAFAETGTQCRLAIKNLDKLLGNNSVLIDQVHRKLEKKNIQIVSTDEVVEGDFFVNDLIAIHKGIITNPLHSYEFKTKSKLITVPCFALPLCSPIAMEKEVTAITGLKYKHQYSIQMMKNAHLVEVKSENFRHSFKQEPKVFLRGESFDGSPEQIDLALALANDIPKCSGLKK